jgi:hypothetical protein
MQPVHLLGLHRDAAAVAEHASKLARMAAGADHPRPPGVHADDLVVVGPDGHQASRSACCSAS